MKKRMYFTLVLRRAKKLYPQIMLITILLVLGLVLSCVLLINKNNSGESKQKICVGIVGDATDTHLGIGVDVLTKIDVSRFSIDFVNIDEETARRKLRRGEISGYLKIPDEFIDSVVHGENVPLVYVTNNSPTGFGSLMMEEIGDIISGLITKAQDAISGANEIVEVYANDGSIQNLNVEYIDNILNRSKVYETEYIGISDSLSLGGYLVCGMLMLFLLLWGITCNPLLSKKDRSFDTLLCSKGQSVFSQVICEIAVNFLVMLTTFLIFAVIIGSVFQFAVVGIPELDKATLSDYLGYIFKIIPVLFMVSSLHVLFYDLISGEIGVILFQFIFALGTGYISGCLYPGYFFPLALQKTAEILPTGAGVSYLRQSMWGDVSHKVLLLVFVYAAVFIILAVLMRRYRMAGNAR